MSENETEIKEVVNYGVDRIIQLLKNAEGEYDKWIDNEYTEIYSDLYDLTDGFTGYEDYEHYLKKEARDSLYRVYYNSLKEVKDSFAGKQRAHEKNVSKSKEENVVPFVPRPCFNILRYPKEDIWEFFWTFVHALAELKLNEEQEPSNEEDVDKITDKVLKRLYPPKSNVRIKKFLNEEIQLGKNYELVYRVMSKSNKDWPSYEDLEKSYGKMYNELRSDIKESGLALREDYNQKEILEFLAAYKVKIFRETNELWLSGQDEKWRKNNEYEENIMKFPDFSSIQKYFVCLNLSIWSLTEGFQQNALHREKCLLENSVCELEKKLDKIEADVKGKFIESDKDKPRKDIFEEYYTYNYMQQKYNAIVLEQQKWDEFFAKRDQNLCERERLEREGGGSKNVLGVNRMNFETKLTREDIKHLTIYLEGSKKRCDPRTFKDHFHLCLKVIEIYAKEKGRNWNLDNLDVEVLKAVYFVHYVYDIKFRSKKLLTWTKKMIDWYENKKKDQEHPDVGARRRSSSAIEESYYFAGTMVSIALMDDRENGKQINDVKYRIFSRLNRIAIYVFLTHCPDIGVRESEISFEESRRIFEDVFDAFCDTVYIGDRR